VRSTPSPDDTLRTMKLGVETTIALGDHDAFVSLQTLARSFLHLDLDDHRVARCKRGYDLAQTGDFFLLKLLDQIHF
jgi:hypothetical protein